MKKKMIITHIKRRKENLKKLRLGNEEEKINIWPKGDNQSPL